MLHSLRATTEMLDSPDVKPQLRNNGEQAIAAGVFGVPTSVIDGRCFWRLDSTEMLVAYLDGDPFFQSDLLKQAQNLPQGVNRNGPRKTT